MALNQQQREAVEHEGGPLIVLAGPGTGKTRVIVHRLAHCMEARRAEPESLLAVTFTVKAAAELRTRLADLVGGARAERIEARTFHGVCWRWLARFADMSGLGGRPILMDSAMRRRRCIAAIESSDAFPDRRREGLKALADRVVQFTSECGHHAITPARATAYADKWAARLASRTRDDSDEDSEPARQAIFTECARAYAAYDEARRAEGLVAFDDMLLDTVRMLSDRPIVASLLRDECRHVVVDEFQDVNTAQVELLRLICPPERRPDLAVVGDDDQAIYAFRGSNERAFHRFTDTWPGTRTLELTQNYRSASAVLAAAATIIERVESRVAPDKVIVRSPELGDPKHATVELVPHAKDQLDGATIAARIIADARRTTGLDWRRFAVLARSRSALVPVADALRADGIPFFLDRQRDIADEPAVADALAWTTVLVQPSGSWAARRLLTQPPFSVRPAVVAQWESEYRAAGSARSTSFVNWLETREPGPTAKRFVRIVRRLSERIAHAPAAEAMDRIVAEGQIIHASLAGRELGAERAEAIIELLSLVRRVQPRLDAPGDLRAFASHFDQLDKGERCIGSYAGEEAIDGSEHDPDEDGVRLLTAHGAKGLEFDTVVLVRTQPAAGGFPNRKSDEREAWLPPELTGGDPRSSTERRDDEERRLFYVALTRAERAVYLLHPELKNPSRSTHYAQEIANRRPPGISATRGKVWIERTSAGQGLLFSERTEPSAREHAALLELRRQIRVEAAAALDLAEDSAGNPRTLREAITRLTEAARELAKPEPEAERDRFDPRDLMRPVPAPVRISYSDVNAYRTCPRCYYLSRVLRLEEPPSPHMALGNVTHQALQRFFSAWRDAESNGLPLPTRDDLRAMVALAFADSARTQPVVAALPESDAFALAEAALDMHDPAAQIIEIEQRDEVPWMVDGEQHRLIVKLDRLDQIAGEHRIIDYKTGKARAELLTPSADDLQFAIYALALRARGMELRGRAEYWVLSAAARGSIDLDELHLDAAEVAIAEMVRGVRAGLFPQRCHQKQPGGWSQPGLCEFLGPDADTSAFAGEHAQDADGDATPDPADL